MRKILSRFILAALFLSPLALAQTGPAMLSIPPGFDGPMARTHQNGAQFLAYVKKIPGQERGTLIQVTTYDFGAQLEGLPADKRGDAAGFYLSQFLAGIQRQRDAFETTQASQVLLDGIPAARAEWQGSSSGFKMSGVMYCAIVGSQVVSLHTQGFADSPAADKKAALAAIEAVKFKKK